MKSRGRAALPQSTGATPGLLSAPRDPWKQRTVLGAGCGPGQRHLVISKVRLRQWFKRCFLKCFSSFSVLQCSSEHLGTELQCW